MRWQKGRRSHRIEDRRGMKATGGIGIIGIIIVLLGWFMGINPATLMQFVETSGDMTGNHATSEKTGIPNPADEVADFTSVILASSEDAWQAKFNEHGLKYRPTTLVTFDNRVRSACGITSSATGPFYCPSDEKIYIDFNFINQMQRMGAQGDFAFAYVIAHEVGHHVQNQLGTLPQAYKIMQSTSQENANKISVLIELQADCYAGIWANYIANGHIQGVSLEQGDLQEGMRAAQAVGDDTISASAGRSVHPENFTHGSASARQQWLQRGITYGSLEQCDTFANYRTP
ncbi:MAG: flagellar biosynthesis protein FlgM [Cardiobacteriales bacterium]|nr:MAG: flagellar biosynthesis protein FlgM [Cardiobacteriales bacterium]